jgi:hypothetical protein
MGPTLGCQSKPSVRIDLSSKFSCSKGCWGSREQQWKQTTVNKLPYKQHCTTHVTIYSVINTSDSAFAIYVIHVAILITLLVVIAVNIQNSRISLYWCDCNHANYCCDNDDKNCPTIATHLALTRFPNALQLHMCRLHICMTYRARQNKTLIARWPRPDISFSAGHDRVEQGCWTGS